MVVALSAQCSLGKALGARGTQEEQPCALGWGGMWFLQKVPRACVPEDDLEVAQNGGHGHSAEREHLVQGEKRLAGLGKCRSSVYWSRL